MKNMQFVSLVVLSLLVVSGAAAQFLLRGTIGGLVTDDTGAVIVDATVTLTDLDRNQASVGVTNASGLFSFPNLVAGPYQISVEQPGFKTGVSDVVVITTNDNVRVDIGLQIGEVTETVEVTTAAPLMQTEQTVVGQVVDETLVEALPALGRNFLAFSTLAPNVSSFPRTGTANATWSVGSHHTIGGVAVQVGGGGDNGLYLNGVNINDSWLGGTQYSPGMENVTEVKVDTANFSASSGRDISTSNVITKSGTNEFHGGAFNFLQNEALNAWHPFVKSEAEPGQRKDKLQRNQFGGNLGGPVRIPGVFDGRNRAFFFVGYEGFDNNSGSSSTQFGGGNLFRVPTTEERQGDYSGLVSRFPNDPNVLLYNPFTTRFDADGNSIRDPIVNNDLRTTGMINQNALTQINEIYPVSNGFVNPNNPDDLRNHRVLSRRTNYNWRIDTRFDYRITDNDNIYVAYSESLGKDDNAGGLFPEFDSNVEDSSYVIGVSYARVFTPTLTNDFTFGWVRPGLIVPDKSAFDLLAQTDTARNRYFQNIGEPGTFGFGMHSIGVEGYAGHGVGGATIFDNPGLQFGDNASWVRGNHATKFGFNYVNKGQRLLSVGGRSVGFSKQFTRSGSIDGSLGGDGMASWMLGVPSSLRSTFDFGEEAWRTDWNDVWGFYFEDKWQLTPKLTLTLGMRFDMIIPTYSPNDYCCAFVDQSYPGWQLVLPGRAEGVPRKVFSADKNNFGPRLGLAYRMQPDLVVRASYGVFYQGGISELRARTTSNVASGSGEEVNNAALGVHDDLPLLTFGEIFRPGQNLVLGNYPVSTGTGTGWFEFPWNCTGECQTVDQETQNDPYYQRWMIDIQKSLGQDMVLSLAYQGARGTKLPYREAINAPPYRTGWPDDAEFVDTFRPNPNGRFRDVRVVRHGHNSFYNAATIKLERRFSEGLQFTSHYTWSKTVTDPFLFTAEYLELFRTAASNLQWDHNRHLGRGEAEYSHPHRWITAVLWQPQWGRNLPAVPRALLHGWRTSLITTFESGNAWTVFNDQSSARDFEPEMPNRVGDPNLSRGSRTTDRFFDTSAFTDPGFDVKGNSGPGTVRGPGQNNWNLNLAKTFAATEKLNVEFRVDMFNLFNHTQFKNINADFSTFTGSTFGWITNSHDGRFIQFGLRVTF